VEHRRETYEYDGANRLTTATIDGASVTVKYDALGNILSKSDVGAYDYCANEGLRVLCAIRGLDGTVAHYAYSRSGDVIRSGRTNITLTAAHQPAIIRQSALTYSTFDYGTDGELLRHTARQRFVRTDTAYLGDVEILREDYAPPALPTPERTRVRCLIAAPTGPVGYFEKTYWHYPMRQAQALYGSDVSAKPERTTRLTTLTRYFVKDQLGSVTAILDEGARVTEQFRYDAWGARRPIGTDRTYFDVKVGFTNHDQLDVMNLVHMGGRVYDARVGRFLSPDPLVQFPLNPQSYNRYAYAFNNPLRYIDPSGFDLFGDIGNFFSGVGQAVGGFIGDVIDATVGKPLAWIGEQLNKAGRWLSENWRTVAVIAVTVALTAFAPGIGPIAIGAIAGGLQGALYGGTVNDVLKGAIIGCVSGSLAAGAGAVAGSANTWTSAFGQGVAGGVTSGITGGDVKRGFVSAFLGRVLVPGVQNAPTAEYRIAAAAVIGGVDAEINGGKFENGAISGALARAFGEAAAGVQQGRPLNGRERDVARAVTGLSDRQLDAVRVYDDRWSVIQPESDVMTPDGSIYWPGSAKEALTDASNVATFAHETAHIMQLDSGRSVVLSAAPLQLLHAITPLHYDPYLHYDQYLKTPSPAGLNVEAQADWYMHKYCGAQPVNCSTGK